MKSVAFILFAIFVLTEGVLKLPSYIHACSRKDPELNKCFVTSANKALPHIAHGDPAYHVKPFAPLKWRHLLEVHIPPLTFALIDINVSGLEKFNVTGANVDLDKREITIKLETPLIVWKAKYRIEVDLGGFLPSEKAEGNVEISYSNGVYDTIVEYEYFDLNNVQFANVTKAFVNFERADLDFNFIGLTWNPAIEEAWAVAKTSFINKEIQEACGWAAAEYINDYWNVVPFSQIFTP